MRRSRGSEEPYHENAQENRIMENKFNDRGTNFSTKASLANHRQGCRGAAPGICTRGEKKHR